MKLPWLCTVAALSLLFVTGCKKAADPAKEIGAAIQLRLSGSGTLNLSGFDTEVKKVTLQGDHAQADVIFRAKNGPGSMQLSYNLEKRNGVWTVLDSRPAGSDFSHPVPGQGDPATSGATGGAAGGAAGGAPGSANAPAGNALHNFNAQPGASPANLPPGHPPVNPNPPAAPQKKP